MVPVVLKKCHLFQYKHIRINRIIFDGNFTHLEYNVPTMTLGRKILGLKVPLCLQASVMCRPVNVSCYCKRAPLLNNIYSAAVPVILSISLYMLIVFLQ